MDRELMTNVISDLYKTIKTEDDLREIRGILNNIEKTLQPENNKRMFSVGDKVESKTNRTITKGEVVGIAENGKVRVKQDKHIWLIHSKTLRLKEEIKNA